MNVAADAAAAGAVSASASPASKSTPHLRSVATSLRSCLDAMLPDAYRNDAAAFHQHVVQHKTRLQSEKNSWRFGLNYQFETLKQHKDWYARNQQYVQFRKDLKRLETHVASLRALLSEAVSTMDLEVGLRGAQLEGRVGAYKILFEVTKIVTKLSRPLVKLQMLKPSDAALSIYCDTFVLDIVLAGGEGAVESASLTTVEKDVSKEFPERNADLLQALQQLAAGDSTAFTEKLTRLIDRAELAAKYPSLSLEQAEEELFAKLAEVSKMQCCWSVSRVVEGVGIRFKDALHCSAVVAPHHKRAKVEDAAPPSEDPAVVSSLDATPNADASPIEMESPTNPLEDGEWSGSISFVEWRGQVCLHVVGDTPIVMVGSQAHLLAVAALQPPRNASLPTAPSEEEKWFGDFVSWRTPIGSAETTEQPIAPQLRFAHDHSTAYVCPPASPPAMKQDFTLVTKEISGGHKIRAFPIPLAFASLERLSNVLQLCGHSLFFHSVLLSMFGADHLLFGHRATESSDALQVPITVDASAPDRLALKTGVITGISQPLLIELSIRPDCSLALSVKSLGDVSSEPLPLLLESLQGMDALSAACHSVPLLTYFVLQRILQRGDMTAAAPTDMQAPVATSEPCNDIVTLDDGGISVPSHLETEDMLLEDIGMF